jgi:ClpP class serine protease
MNIDIFSILWVFFILLSVIPIMQQRMIAARRLSLIHQIEKKRSSRVITLIHRQEALAILGTPIYRYINIEDSEEVLRAIRLTPPDMPLDLILHTPGGLVLAAEQIAHALVRHKGKVTVFIPHYAMSGGTLLAMGADEIIMDENAVLGPVDPQLGEYPAVSILEAVKLKSINELDDRTIILADIARKALAQVHDTVKEILMANGMAGDKATDLAAVMTCGRWTHDYPIGLDEAKALGLPVQAGLPAEIYELMSLYPQANQGRPSVQYIPMPYRRENEQPK